MSSIMKFVKKVNTKVLLLLLAMFLLVLMVFSFYIHHRAKSIGSGIGNLTGQAVGTALGSFTAFQHGYSGYQDGSWEGINSHDTVANVKGFLQSIGKLEVLSADVELNSSSAIGEKYHALYLMNGQLVFNVDLNDIDVAFDDDNQTITVCIPKPEYEIVINQDSIQRIAVDQKFSATVNAEDGYNAYLSSIKDIKANISDSLINFKEINGLSSEAALKQVELFLTTVCDKSLAIKVQYKLED